MLNLSFLLDIIRKAGVTQLRRAAATAWSNMKSACSSHTLDNACIAAFPQAFYIYGLSGYTNDVPLKAQGGAQAGASGGVPERSSAAGDPDSQTPGAIRQLCVPSVAEPQHRSQPL